MATQINFNEISDLTIETALEKLNLTLQDCTADTYIYIVEEDDTFYLEAAEKHDRFGTMSDEYDSVGYVISYDWQLDPSQTAEIKGVSKQAVYDILHKDDRRRKIFPNAVKIGQGKRGVWILDAKDVAEWQPRQYPRT